MAKTPAATLKAINKYNQKSKYIQLKFTENQMPDYQRIVQYCDKNDLSYQGYIKALIKADLDSKGIVYPDLKEDECPDCASQAPFKRG